jgi:hypothetical protein
VPIHWTYRIPKPSDDLSQGDIIARTDSVLKILDGVHNYFRNEKYLCFIVLTQSCDLVMRGGTCKARQIGLGVVRALDEILAEVFGDICGAGAARVYSQAGRADAQEFVERLLNQNEWGHGFFYLHPNADVSIAVEAVAVLRVSISLRSREHYKTLRKARCGALDTEYRNKLGWLTGNLYSRVDTTDWAEQEGGKAALKKLVGKLLDGEGEVKNIWVPDLWLKAAKEKQIDIGSLARSEILPTLRTVAPPSSQEIALERIREKIDQVLGEFNEKQCDRLVQLVQADSACPIMSAQTALAAVRELYVTAGGQAIAILESALPDPRWTASLVTQITHAIGKFKELRSARTVAALLEIVKETNLFADSAIDCVCEITLGAIGSVAGEHIPTLVERLKALKMPAPMVAHLNGLIRQTNEESLGEKLTRRLINDPRFNGALRHD